MPIIALLQEAAFDPETTHILATAFDKAWNKFKSSGNALADEPGDGKLRVRPLPPTRAPN
jgi:hypothetical protein